MSKCPMSCIARGDYELAATLACYENPPKTVPVCPNAPLSLGTENVQAVLESIPYEQVKNLQQSSTDYSLY